MIHARAIAIIAALVLAIWAIVLWFPTAVGAHVQDEDSGRRVYLGDWAGLVRCEAPAFGTGGDANELNHTGSGAAGLFQVMPRTWTWVAERHGKTRLATKHPTEVTVAQQLRQAIRLRDMPGGGLSHWSCRTYGQGDGWITIYDEARLPRNPARCARNLEQRWDLPRRTARTVCGVTDD